MITAVTYITIEKYLTCTANASLANYITATAKLQITITDFEVDNSLIWHLSAA